MVEATRQPASSEPTVIDPFERFANEPIYRQLNSEFVDSLDFKPGEVVLDLACGPGNIARLVVPKIGSDGVIYEVDPSGKAISAAKREIGKTSVNVHFVQGRAEDLDELLPNMTGAFDKVICGNAVHNFSDKLVAFKNVFGLLKNDESPFAFNTSFFEGSMSAEEQTVFLGRWIRRAMRIAVADLGVERTKGRMEKAEASPIKDLTPGDYCDLLEQAGFRRVVEVSSKTWMLPMSAYNSIAEDEEFLAGSMQKLPPDIATLALQKALDSFLEAGKVSSPRDWLTVIAYKR